MGPAPLVEPPIPFRMSQSQLFASDEQRPSPDAVRPRRPRKQRKPATPVALASLPYTIDAVHLCDCIEAMRRMPDQCVDLAIVDPPYNTSKGGDWKWDNSVVLPGMGGNWSKVMESWDSMGLGDYLAFTLAWASELKRLVRPTGSLWIHGTYHNIGIVNFVLQSLGIEIINEVIWFKRNSFPNLAGRRLTASHETILWAHTGKSRQYLFNYEASKDMACPEDSLKSAGKQMRTVWDIPNNKDASELQFGKHPTQKPLRLLTRMIALSATPGGLCLVPFAGAGSECVAARQAGLRFIGFEKEAEYAAISKQRLAAESVPHLFSVTPADTGNQSPGQEEAVDDSNDEHEHEHDGTVPSLIKWTGSKRSQAAAIRDVMPTYQKYFEPFVGSGAVLYTAACPGSVAADLYEPLVKLWLAVQLHPEGVIQNYRDQWHRLQQDIPNYFYVVRQRFNATHDPLDLCFLMRTCVNGIVRFNDKGDFNNSFHLSRKGMVPDTFADIVRRWTRRLEGVTFLCQDYETTVSQAQPTDFVYFDPPYAGNKQRYTADLDIERFYTVIESLNARGVRWAWSFDGQRGDEDLSHPVPPELYKRRLMLTSGNSAVAKVLNGPVERVHESLYLNY
jgi:DNA adenine methylase Dam